MTSEYTIQPDGANLQKHEGMRIQQEHAGRRWHLGEVLSNLELPLRVPAQEQISRTRATTTATYGEAIW